MFGYVFLLIWLLHFPILLFDRTSIPFIPPKLTPIPPNLTFFFCALFITATNFSLNDLASFPNDAHTMFLFYLLNFHGISILLSVTRTTNLAEVPVMLCLHHSSGHHLHSSTQYCLLHIYSSFSLPGLNLAPQLLWILSGSGMNLKSLIWHTSSPGPGLFYLKPQILSTSYL